MDIQFKKYGDGHKLTEDTRSNKPVKVAPSTGRAVLSESAQRAGEAAMIRMSQPDKKIGTGSDAIQRQVRAELQAEKDAMEAAQKRANKTTVVKAAPVLHVEGVYYTCPLVGDDVLPKDQMETRIHEYLLGQLGEVPEMASALMIYTLNKDREAVRLCVDTLCKYLDNIITNPGEDKYRRIRLHNKALQERVLKLQGAEEFIQAVGFNVQTLPFQDTSSEFYVLSEDKTTEDIINAKEFLQNAEPIRPELDRGMRILDGNRPGLVLQHTDLPDEFFSISKEELKREQQIRREAVENLGMLRTKAMRERDEQRELRKYRFALIRVRFPDNTILQGTFRATEKLTALLDYVRASLDDDWIPFSLSGPTGHRLAEEERTIAELQLAPAAIVTFTLDESVAADVSAARGAGKLSYVKPDLLDLKK